MSPPRTVGEVGELGLLEALQGVFSRRDPRVLLGIGDDAAILQVQGHLVATVDSIEAGVDWLADLTPRDAVGHRAAAVNLSDLAAMGARPRGLLLALELPADLPVDDVVRSAQALVALADAHGASVVGGDIGIGTTERWTVTALGTVRGPALRRDAARLGDRVWLVGDVGMAALGLAQLAEGPREQAEESGPGGLARCVQAHLRPRPMIDAGIALRGTGARIAAIDISDGLAVDARRLAAASGLRLELTLPRPRWLTPELAAVCARRGWDWRKACAEGGDDYALLVCAEPDLEVDGLLVGRVTAGGGVALAIDGEDHSAAAGFLHGGPKT